MRLSSLVFVLGAATAAVAQVSQDDPIDNFDEYDERESTVFNGEIVPPLPLLTPSGWNKAMEDSKYLVVKHYSPYCGHCQEFAPTFQTLYEYYWTSKPGGTGNFTEFYDFQFGMINCVAYQDFCSALGVTAWPTTIFFEDGEELEKFKGVKEMKTLSDRIEKILETAKPGSRPAKIELPDPGAAGTAEYLKANPPAKLGKEKVKNEETGTTTAKETEKAATATAKPTEASADVGTKPNTQAATPVYNAAPKKASKPSVTPNINGTSVPLNAETFQRLVTLTQDPWFIKFYAPWCHHCQAMAPNWEQLAKEMKGRLNIGEVNCDAESRLCKDARLRGYPTILFFKGGERVEYEGLRGIGDFVSYAEKAVDLASGIQDVDLASFKALEEKEEVIFVYFYDHATTSEDFLALERFPLSLIGRAKLVKTRDPKMYERFKISTWPRLLVSREGRPTYYNPLTPREMRDTHLVLNWMKSVWLPLIPELTASNAREIMDGKLVVLGILNREDQDSFLSAKREMKSAASEWMDKQIQLFQLERQDLRDAKQLRIEEAEDRGDQRALRAAKNIRINMDRSDRKEVTFAWVDGTFWQRWLRTTYGIDIKDGERVIINDEDNRRYWDQTSTGNYIVPSRTSILETINKVTASPPKIKPKLTISSIEKVFFDIRVTFTEHPYLSMGCILGIAFGCASWFRGRLRRGRGHFRLDDNSKAPILGANTNGAKVD
ncbi:thioredoxin-like protein [Immersiella caudata]|uniref:Thioredoxin-like protein n=1 Tax=Immersiella caudata TaxID=314043 RepID=A0AA39X5D3_9PEZI|nr:thioredoxin-like protein [Immersiella caudata]